MAKKEVPLTVELAQSVSFDGIEHFCKVLIDGKEIPGLHKIQLIEFADKPNVYLMIELPDGPTSKESITES